MGTIRKKIVQLDNPYGSRRAVKYCCQNFLGSRDEMPYSLLTKADIFSTIKLSNIIQRMQVIPGG